MNDRSHILLVDDDPSVIHVLSRILRGLGDLRFATSGPEAIRLALEATPDLILLDVEMPEMNGLEVCKALKCYRALADVPIIFVTGHDSTEQEALGLSLGAVDFISKPPRAPVVQARVRTQLRMKQMADQLRRQAATDGLTGVANRRHFDDVAMREWLRARRNATPLSLLLVDIDYFKAYNDCYGHPAGDHCLRSVAQAMEQVAKRPADLLARYGGEEFALVLPDTDGRGAERIAAELVEAIDKLELVHARSLVADHVTVSVGGTAYDASSPYWQPVGRERRGDSSRPQPSLAWLIAAADQALYAAKQTGRRRACFARLDDVAPAGLASAIRLEDAHVESDGQDAR